MTLDCTPQYCTGSADRKTSKFLQFGLVHAPNLRWFFWQVFMQSNCSPRLVGSPPMSESCLKTGDELPRPHRRSRSVRNFYAVFFEIISEGLLSFRTCLFDIANLKYAVDGIAFDQ